MIGYRILVFAGWLLLAALVIAPPSDFDMRQGLWVKTFVWVPVLLLLSLGCREAVWRKPTHARWLFATAAILVVFNIFVDYVVLSVILDLPRNQLTGWRYSVMSVGYLGTLVAGLSAFLAVIIHAATRDQKISSEK